MRRKERRGERSGRGTEGQKQGPCSGPGCIWLATLPRPHLLHQFHCLSLGKSSRPGLRFSHRTVRTSPTEWLCGGALGGCPRLRPHPGHPGSPLVQPSSPNACPGIQRLGKGSDCTPPHRACWPLAAGSQVTPDLLTGRCQAHGLPATPAT